MALYKIFKKSLGVWTEKSVMADATETTALHTGHMTYSPSLVVRCEKNVFHLFRFIVITAILDEPTEV